MAEKKFVAFATPVLSMVTNGGSAVVLMLPDGTRIALTPHAAELTNRHLAALLPQALAQAHNSPSLGNPSMIRRFHCFWQRQKREAAAFLTQGQWSTRCLVGAIMLPLVWAFFAMPILAIAAFALPPVWCGVAALILLLLTPLVAWFAAPLLMSEDELRPARSGFTPKLVAPIFENRQQRAVSPPGTRPPVLF
ncbi:MAG: hypothetical protein KA482_10960 [Sphingobium sp.]|nr:hypothetical protein [Sphingobium sp.]MBP8672051.1 hypothetical protein [Sphingobium sp.]MBP9158934.1 hypothetical protein [Sphingobium sp.]MCC6481050.1 hypothetical protein [Sphingomonadaceae bacterium]